VGATACTAEVVGDADALVAAVDRDTIAIVDAELARGTAGLHSRPSRAWIAVPGEGSTPATPEVAAALLDIGWRHVVTHAMPILAEELLATVQKLARRDVFGLDKYIVWGATVKSYTLANTGDRDDVVAALAKDVVALGLPDRVASLVSVVADELVTNALYVAPVEDGKRIRASEPRDKRRALTGRDEVTVRLATDARYLAIEVRDRWGSIDPMDLARRLAHTPQGVQADVGMGLPLVYACCNQLVVNCAPRSATETIALVDVRYKPTELGRAASFHVFVEEAAGAEP
jgi:hypothetical protein